MTLNNNKFAEKELIFSHNDIIALHSTKKAGDSVEFPPIEIVGDGSEEFTGTLWIAGDYIITVVTADHPHYLIEIHDKVLAHNLREIFKQLWKKIA